MSIVELRACLASLPRYAGRRFPAQVRAALIDHALRARRAGVAWSVLARQTGVPIVTLRRLHAGAQSPAAAPAPKLVPVVSAAGVAAIGSSGSLILRLPSGAALHGLTLDDATRLLRALA